MANGFDGASPHRRRAVARGTLLAAGVLLAAAGVVAVTGATNATGWRLVGWNNLGMHCMDGQFGVFAILPPYNTVEAQLVDASGHLVKSPVDVTVTYQAVADPGGSINTTSAGKTDFWDNVVALFGAGPPVDTGLAGASMPGTANVPQPMAFDASQNLFQATGIPVTPYDDAHQKNYYPMMRLTARDSSGAVLATTDVVLPVSDEMDCSACHASGSGPAAKPAAGWVNDPDPQRDFRLNVLRKHDDVWLGSTTYASALAAKGYNGAGLYDTVVQNGKPILCAACHGSEALGAGSYPGVPPLTQSMHALHATVTDPTNGLTLEASTNRSACYRCHPGSTTRCLRGVMGNSVAADGSMAMQCQACHGSMSSVGSSTRTGWLMEPNCQNCHTGTAVRNNGQIRYTSALDTNGQPRVAVDSTFATTPGTPGAGLSLYRFSAGHGGLQCESCHGSTHAEFPSSHVNDNVQSMEIQGHSGPLVECASCHPSGVSSPLGGPHGMHPAGASWVSSHGDAVERYGRAACQSCHGTDYRGTVLSRSFADRTLSTEFGTKTFWNGFQVGCYTCHNGPGSESANPNAAPVVTNLSASTSAGASVAVTLHATDANGDPLTLRIVGQPQNGTAGLSGTTATYFAYAGFTGTDTFTYAANDGQTDSNLGHVTVTVGGGSGCSVTCGASAPGSGSVGTALSFNGSAATSGCSGSPAYDWNFGDGSAHGATASATHAYSAAGTYTWVFTASSGSASCNKSGTVVVSAPSCTITCSATVPSSGRVGQELTFSGAGTSSCGAQLQFLWQFGDGTGPASDPATSHKYVSAGTYTWQLTVTGGGASCSKTGTITISPAVTPPTITSINQLTSPFRLKISGSGFQRGVKVYIGSDSSPWANTTYQSGSSLLLGGSGLKNKFPSGASVPIRVVNPDGGSATGSFRRGSSGEHR
jgi:PKD repeat protein